MVNKVIYTKNAPEAIGPYSQAYVANGFLYTSGQIAIDPKTNTFIEGDIVEQTKQVMENIKNLLEASGYSFDDVIKTTCFLKNMDDFSTFNEIYGSYFTSKPARSCVAAQKLPKDALVEVEVIAHK